MEQWLCMALNLTRITHGSYFKVPSSVVKFFVKVFKKLLLSQQKIHHGTKK